jgi:small-conductance mechanosensitive channel
MIELATSTLLHQATNGVGAFLPRLAGALALLVIGLLLAGLIRRILLKLLSAVGVDALAERTGVSEVLARAGLGRSLEQVLAAAIRIALVIVVIFAALSLLGLQFLSQSLNEGVLLLPQLLVAAALLLAGVVLGGFARTRVERLAFQLDFPVPLGYLAQVAVIAVFAISAAAQIAIATAVLMMLAGIVLAGVVAALALAFGLGGKDFARALSAGRHVVSAYQVGEEITVAGERGTIAAIQGATTVLYTEDGRVHVPNHLLLESIVRVHETRHEPPDSR